MLLNSFLLLHFDFITITQMQFIIELSFRSSIKPNKMSIFYKTLEPSLHNKDYGTFNDK